jgi:hypothetical protein
MPCIYNKIKSNNIVTEVDSRSIIKEHTFRLNPISKLFCSSLILILLIIMSSGGSSDGGHHGTG